MPKTHKHPPNYSAPTNMLYYIIFFSALQEFFGDFSVCQIFFEIRGYVFDARIPVFFISRAFKTLVLNIQYKVKEVFFLSKTDPYGNCIFDNLI